MLRIKGLISIAALLMFVEDALAYGRGGGCHSAICEGTGILVLFAIVVGAALVALEDIKEKGLLAGIIQNRVLVPLVVIGGGGSLLIWLVAQSFKLNEDLAMVGLIVCAIWFYSRIGKNDDHSKNS
ncbi:MAG: hypothetical protein KYX62_04240 [Pseudomonadota bacterium]|nr:hypothetical protein [Pseudomonadota bacterium]